MHQDEIMVESNANLNIQATHETKEETKQKDKNFLKAENIQHFNAPKSVISENQISKLGNYNDSQSWCSKLLKIDQDMLSIGNKDFLLNSQDSEIEFIGQDLYGYFIDKQY